MKKIISFLLLSVILIPVLGIFYSQQVYAKRIKREVKESILNHWNEGESIEITVTDEEIDTKKLIVHEQDFEIEIDGVMYDVISQKKDGLRTIFKCILDKKESLFRVKLKAQLADYFGHSPFHREHSKSFFSLLKSMIFQELHIVIRHKFSHIFNNSGFIYRQNYAHLYSKFIFSPPRR